MTGRVLDWAFLIGLAQWLELCLSTVWLWSGAKRNRLGQLAAGLLQLVSGALFIHVTVINVYARMDNAYLSNGLLGAHLILAGLILLAASLTGYGMSLWLAGLLVVAYPALGVFILPLVAQFAPYVACLLTSVALFALGRFIQRWWLAQPPNEVVVSGS